MEERQCSVVRLPYCPGPTFMVPGHPEPRGDGDHLSTLPAAQAGRASTSSSPWATPTPREEAAMLRTRGRWSPPLRDLRPLLSPGGNQSVHPGDSGRSASWVRIRVCGVHRGASWSRSTPGAARSWPAAPDPRGVPGPVFRASKGLCPPSPAGTMSLPGRCDVKYLAR